MMELVLKPGASLPTSTTTVVWGAPSVGNVGQLGVDVLLASLARKGALARLGSIESTHVFPVTGYDDLSKVPYTASTYTAPSSTTPPYPPRSCKSPTISL